MQPWSCFGAEGVEKILQHEDTLDFNAFTCKYGF
jgi:hypothetical protein